ncbi:MAG: serine hydrolase domain-containing protein, partial [Acidobacteriota bacterium]|nr:serine hydrolase domain-containing protein [Acidobacteriota bacterium]
GVADVESGVLATASTPYRIASVTKPLAAVVAMRLVEEGVVDLDRKMSGYSEWEDFCVAFSQQPSIFAQGLVCDPAEQPLRHLLSHTAIGAPGTGFSYNPVLYSWASRPLMAGAGRSFSGLVDEYVFQPAGMDRSARIYRDLPLPEDLARALAPPHRMREDGKMQPAPYLKPQGDGAAGGVVSTVLDLVRFDIALDRGELISKESRTAMMAPNHSKDGAELPYGLGWFLEDYKGHRLVWHSGWWEKAYSALYLKVPDQGLTFLVLANSEGVWWGNPLDRAEVRKSDFARLFLGAFLGR